MVEALVLQEIYRSMREKSSDFTGFGYEKGRATWGSLLGNVARANHENPTAFAGKVLGALLNRGAQLWFTTAWLGTIFGEPDLSLFGDPRTRQLYSVIRQRKWAPPEAFRVLVDAFQHEGTAGAERTRTSANKDPDPDVAAAEKIERSLLAALRT
jgi:hypothetical protein